MNAGLCRVPWGRANLKSIGRKAPYEAPHAGFMLIELIAAITIILVLATMALPFARVQIIRSRETELRVDLREMREAIDQYKRYSEAGIFPKTAESFGYPPDLEALVKGTTWPGRDFKFKFLRRIPVDPMTGNTDWGFRSMQDDPDSRSWGRQNLFDVYSKSDKTALDGTHYSDW